MTLFTKFLETKRNETLGVPIPSVWKREIGNWDRYANTFTNRRITPYPPRQILVEVEDRDGEDIIHFRNGPTGFESYYLKDLMEWLREKEVKPPRGEILTICAGTINSWPSCTVLRSDIVSALEELGRM